MNHQDWRTVDIGRRAGSALTHEEEALKQRQLQRAGFTTSHKKEFKMCNSNTTSTPNAKKLDNATESSKIETSKCGQEIMKARAAKKLNRKQLAQLVNKKEEVIASFENNNARNTSKQNNFESYQKKVTYLNFVKNIFCILDTSYMSISSRSFLSSSLSRLSIYLFISILSLQNRGL